MKYHIAAIESEALQDFNNGDEAAINHLFKRYWRELVYFSNDIIKNKEDAEDIVVEAFIKLLNKKKDFDNYSDIQGFLFTASRNACLDLLKHKKVISKAEKEMLYLLENDENFGERKMMKTNLVSLAALVETLPEKRKEIFKLLLEGMSVVDVAHKLKITVDTVRVQKSRAINQLSYTLAKSGTI